MRPSALITHGTATLVITVRKTAPATHESITDSDAVSVWPRFEHKSVTANRLVRANAIITHGTATPVVSARKTAPATHESIMGSDAVSV